MAELVKVDPSEVPEIVANLRRGFNTGKTRPKEYRLAQLKNLLRMLDENEDQITTAVYNDLRRTKRDTVMMEFLPSKTEIITAINNLDDWMKPEYVKKELVHLINSVYIEQEPFGIVCIFSAWNYPLLILMQPMASAIAAGNAVLLKPSEVALHTSNAMMELIPKYMDPECFGVVAGGIPLAQAVLKERFDYIMYTGNGMVGKIVMKSAAEHLTPVTLELGGKSPCYVDSSANLKVAGRRIAWGKYANAGQTCLAPDYVLCHKSVRDELVDNIKAAVLEYYGEDPKNSKAYSRVINENHFDRVERLIKGGGQIVLGGDTDKDDLYVAPTIIVDVNSDDVVMQEEVFGPVLPVVVVDDLDAAIQFINAREKPLALYAFTTDKQAQKRLSSSTSSGGFVVNDVMFHFGILTLPFGGVGKSGFGSCHGKFGFDAFTHKKACYVTTSITEPLLGLRYPPITERKVKLAKSFIIPKIKQRSYFNQMIFLCLTVAVAAWTLRALGYSFF